MIPVEVAWRLLDISQTILSNIEIGNTLAAKCALMLLTAHIVAETDQSAEINKWKAMAGDEP